MKLNYWHKQPSSFAETVQLVESFVQAQIIKETKDKQLFYHTLDHALAVKCRAGIIFQAIRPNLAQDLSANELERLESLINLSALAHDMVQLFESSTPLGQPRKRLAGLSEVETANKLLKYIQNLNQELTAADLKSSILFTDHDQQIVQDAIIATICRHDSPARIAGSEFSNYSIYQPYLYESQPKISIAGSIIALADLGALGMDGVKAYICDGVLVFLEDNPHYRELIVGSNSQRHLMSSYSGSWDSNLLKTNLLAMTRFIVAFAHDRKARFELEIAGFPPQIRQTLREQVFIYLSQENIKKIESVVPTRTNVSLEELINFFSYSLTTEVPT